VDAAAAARRILKRVLEGVGVRVATAASASEALAALANATQDEGPDILISDIGMPGQDGYDLIREVRRSGHNARELPAMALTAFAHDSAAQEAKLAGFQIHVAKPIDIRTLTEAIVGLTGRQTAADAASPK
jgi:CheY-like chemotaxis protein